MRVRPLGQKDPVEQGVATHSSISAWGIPWTEEPGGLHSPWGHRVRTSLATEHACTRAHVMGRVVVLPHLVHTCGFSYKAST